MIVLGRRAYMIHRKHALNLSLHGKQGCFAAQATLFWMHAMGAPFDVLCETNHIRMSGNRCSVARVLQAEGESILQNPTAHINLLNELDFVDARRVVLCIREVKPAQS